jgi:iron complex outermembrane receptor protein
MTVKTNISVLLCILCAVLLRAQTPADTVPVLSKTQNLNSVDVRTYKHAAPSARFTNLSGAVIRNKGNTLTELLQENTGIYLKNYGPGMLSTIAFRGTGAEHTALVWNGITINYPVLGLADFSTIPANGFGMVTLQHGSSSTNFGSSAIGGAVLLGNNLSYTSGSSFVGNDTLRASATFETGSYGRYFGSVFNTVGNAKFNSRTTAQWLTSNNNFNFVNTFKFGKPTERQVNSALAQRAFMQDFDFIVGASIIGIKVWYNYTDREIPPTLTSNDTKAKQIDESIRLLADWKFKHIVVRGAYVHDYIEYADNYLVSNSKMSTTTLQAENTFWFRNYMYLKVGAEGQFFTADIVDYNGFKTEWRASALAIFRYEPMKRYSLMAGYRHIIVQGFKTAAAPSFGATYKLIKDNLLAKLSVSRSFRVPTLNERYWVPGGNPDLKAEGGWNYEAGLAYTGKKKDWTFTGEATGFAMQINNWLQWQPTNFGYWTASNLKQVLSRGAEVTCGIGYNHNTFNLRVDGAYALAIATNQKNYTNLPEIIGKDLIYTPRNVASGGVTVGYKGFSLFVNVQYTGVRYTTTDNIQSVDGYWLLNTRLSKSINLKTITLDVWMQAYNITNNGYFNLPYRPMPLRNYRAGITISFNKTLKLIN